VLHQEVKDPEVNILYREVQRRSTICCRRVNIDVLRVCQDVNHFLGVHLDGGVKRGFVGLWVVVVDVGTGLEEELDALDEGALDGLQ